MRKQGEPIGNWFNQYVSPTPVHTECITACPLVSSSRAKPCQFSSVTSNAPQVDTPLLRFVVSQRIVQKAVQLMCRDVVDLVWTFDFCGLIVQLIVNLLSCKVTIVINLLYILAWG